MRTGAFVYFACAWPFLMADTAVTGYDLLPDWVGVLLMLWGLYQLRRFEYEMGTGFYKGSVAAAGLICIAAACAALPEADGLPVQAAAFCCRAAIVHVTCKNMKLLSAAAGKRSLTVRFQTGRRAQLLACAASSLAAGKLFSPIATAVIAACTLSVACFVMTLLLRAQRELRPFYG